MKVLIAEKDVTARLDLQLIVEQQGHQVFVTDNGVDAVKLFQEFSPNLILIDDVLPGLDGFETVRQIKILSKNRYASIVFLTSLQETDAVVKCIDAGGDDYFIKPFNKLVIAAKINAINRTFQLYKTIAKQRDKIQYHTKHLIQEQEVAKKIFDNIAHQGALNKPYIHYKVSPMSVFNGDILLAANRPLGGLNVFLGDFTGHGLPAAIGAMPTSDIFFGMTMKGFELYEIIHEINRRLNVVLPTGFFCCAVAAQIDFDQQNLRIWNGGLPDAYILRGQSGEMEEVISSHLPLGILGPHQFKTKVEIMPFVEGDSLFVYSDGVIEAENDLGQMFGRERLVNALSIGAQSGDAYETVCERVKEFKGNIEQGDDITFIEIKNCDLLTTEEPQKTEELNITDGPSDASFSICLGPESLRNYNPLPVLAQQFMEIGNLRSYRTQVLTIMTELYSNALEHGVLGLNSELKASPDGFADYYHLRQVKLNGLKSGYVKITVWHESTDNGGRLRLEIEDSGKGFNYKKFGEKYQKNKLSGRGFSLIYRLADSVEFSKGGARVNVTFVWDSNSVKASMR